MRMTIGGWPADLVERARQRVGRTGQDVTSGDACHDLDYRFGADGARTRAEHFTRLHRRDFVLVAALVADELGVRLD